MYEVVIPTNSAWNEIFQYYTGEDITIKDIVSYLKTLSNKRVHIQSGGNLGWLREGARLVRIAIDAAAPAAEGAAAGGALGGPPGAAAGAVGGLILAVGREVLIQGGAAIIAAPAGPAAPMVQRTIVTGVSVLLAGYAAYVAWSRVQDVDGLVVGGGDQQDMVSSYLSEMKPMIDELEPVIYELKRICGNEKFKTYLENINETVILSKKQMPMRVFSTKDIFATMAFTHLYTGGGNTTRNNRTQKRSNNMKKTLKN